MPETNNTFFKMIQEIRSEVSNISSMTIRHDEKLNSLLQTKETAETGKDIAEMALESTKSAHKRLDKLENTLSWFLRTVGGIIIVAIMSLILINTKGG